MTAPTDSGSTGIEIVIEISTVSAAQRVSAAEFFKEHEVFVSRAFGGQDLVTILAKPVTSLFEKLSTWLFSADGKKAKTVVKIGVKEINLEGYTSDQVRGLLESPGFRTIVKELGKR